MNRTEWKAEVRKALTLQGKTYQDIADGIGVSNNYVRQIMCGKKNLQSGIDKISEYLNIYPCKIEKK